MLNLYGAFKVPDVKHVMIYRDDENPHKFYMVPERPGIARDDSNAPLFNFILYARDVDRLEPEEREVERAYLSLSTHVAVSSEDEEKIRNHLKNKLTRETNRNLFFLRRPILRHEPELGYPSVFTGGSVEFVTFSNELVPFSTGSETPSLLGTNIASFSQQLNQDGAELFRQSVEKGLVPAIINYKLEFLARIPAISIKIKGDRSQFYEELKQHAVTYKWKSPLGIFHYMKVIPSYTARQFWQTFHSLTIEIEDNDFRDMEDGDDINQKLEEMAFRIIENNILPDFFDTGFPLDEEQEEGEESRKWLAQPDKVRKGTIDINIKRSDVVKLNINPNAQLGEVLTPGEVETNTMYIDLGDPYFRELDVSISANVNFQDDPVYAVKVFLDYKHYDEVRGVSVEEGKEFLFKNSDKIHRFRQIMAKDGDGSPKDTYKYWSEIIYKDTGETIRIPEQGTLESRERELVISYRRLGFVRVTLVLGTMPDNVTAVRAKVYYPDEARSASEQIFELNREKPTATFFTYTGHAGEPEAYRYQVSYILDNGRIMNKEEQAGQSDLLTITNPFKQTVMTRFLAQGDFSVVDKIIIDAVYEDADNDFSDSHHAQLVSNGETSMWEINLSNPEKKDMEYKVTIIYKNGSREEKPAATDRELGETIPVGTGAIDVLEITIIPGMIDWTKYKLVLVYLEYKDKDNNIKENRNFTFKQADGTEDKNWKVLLRDKGKQAYSYRLRYFGVNSEDNKEIDWKESTDPILVLEN